MSELAAPYQVVYSKRVREHLLVLTDQATQRGDGKEFLESLKEFHHRLCIYQWFVYPLIDLRAELGQVRIGIIRPLSIRYGLYEDRR